jgi:beta-aspartyl-peptidase (threonine type)
MQKYGIVIHGGAGPDSDFIKKHKKEYHKALKEAANAGYKILQDGGSAVDAVQAAVMYMEDCPLFNAGCGAELTEMGKVEMCASIMDGKKEASGAVATVRNIKNPVWLARQVMDQTKDVYISETGADRLAREVGAEMMPDYYFITDNALESLKKKKEKGDNDDGSGEHGTVGAVACDSKGNIAAATSTGGLANCNEGRVADSSMIGVGTFAHNATCAVSCTGTGEYTIRNVIAHDISAVVEYKGYNVKDAAQFVVHEKNGNIDGDLGVICMDAQADWTIEFNTERMHRAWRVCDMDEPTTAIYPDEGT